MKPMKKFTGVLKNNTSIYIYGIFFAFIVWYIISISQGYGNLIFPGPIETVKKLGEILGSKTIYISILWTMLRTLIGFISAFILALILGISIGSFKKTQVFFKPLITILKSAPTAAFVFLFLILSGSRYAPIYIVFILSFPILYEAMVGGLNNIDKEVIDAVKLDGGDNLTIFFNVKLPLSIPYLFVGVLSSFALSLKTAIMAEIIAGDTNYGLGSMITAYRNLEPANLTPIFSITLVAIIIIIVIDLVASRLLKLKKDY